MSEPLLKSNHVIFYEMLSHPALFTHRNPKSVGILGEESNELLKEVLKHPHIAEIHASENTQAAFSEDKRLKWYPHQDWLAGASSGSMDILMTLTEEPTPTLLKSYFSILSPDGILVQPSSSLFQPAPLKWLMDQLKIIGFQDLQILHFPQPDYPSGWRTAIVALKYGIFKPLREKIIYNKSFKTHYYNFDIHRASMVLPEFMRENII